VLVRGVIAVGVLLIVCVFALEMSGSAARTADSNHVGVSAFVATVPGGGDVCEPVSGLPDDAARARVLVGSFDRPVPALGLRFTNARGRTVAAGTFPGGTKQGFVDIPITRSDAAGTETKACLHVAGHNAVAIGGRAAEAGPGSEVVDGKPEAANISLVYLRRGSESWWQLLPTLAHRFARGKTGFFGTWTLVVVALVMLAVWAAAVRLLIRELR
jgi:hypothetical protein